MKWQLVEKRWSEVLWKRNQWIRLNFLASGGAGGLVAGLRVDAVPQNVYSAVLESAKTPHFH